MTKASDFITCCVPNENTRNPQNWQDLHLCAEHFSKYSLSVKILCYYVLHIKYCKLQGLIILSKKKSIMIFRKITLVTWFRISREQIFASPYNKIMVNCFKTKLSKSSEDWRKIQIFVPRAWNSGLSWIITDAYWEI